VLYFVRRAKARVRASDAYMTALLERLLKAHTTCGGQALLLSATLGSVARNCYLSIGSGRAPIPPSALSEAATRPYPAISSARAGNRHYVAVKGNPRAKLVHWQLLDTIDQPESLVPLLKGMKHGLGPLRSQGGKMDGVYLDLRVLEATKRLIAARPTRSLPDENRELVEYSTHPEALAKLVRELGADWEKFGQDGDGSIGAKGSFGRLQALRYDSEYGELMFPSDGEKLATRLGAADRLVIFDPPLSGPFGTQVRELAMRHHQMPRGLPPETQPSEITMMQEEAGFEFTLGPARYRYSRFGLERLKKEDTNR